MGVIYFLLSSCFSGFPRRHLASVKEPATLATLLGSNDTEARFPETKKARGNNVYLSKEV